MGLILALLDVALSQRVPFCQLQQQLQSLQQHGSTKAYLHYPLCFILLSWTAE